MNQVEQAFTKVPREYFLPENVRISASLDRPISIGYGQTNSQPTTVRMMLEWLDVQPGQNVLDVGAGSGWTTALLSYLVGDKVKVIGVELVPELVKFANQNIAKLNLKNAVVYQAKDVIGWPDEAPYDRILVSAAAEKMPAELIAQLKSPGNMVIPIQNTMYVLSKDNEGKLSQETYPGFLFVPLLS